MMHSGVTSEMLYLRLAELALQSHEQDQFRQAWLQCIASYFDVDSAMVSVTSDGRSFVSTSLAEASPAQDMKRYIDELQPDELDRMFVGRMVLDTEIWSAERRAQLLLYRDFLVPRGVTRVALRGWLWGGKAFFSLLAKHAETSCFTPEDLRELDAVFPVIAAGEALHAHGGQSLTKRPAALARVSSA